MQRIVVCLLVLLAAACTKEKMSPEVENASSNDVLAGREKFTNPERKVRESVKKYAGSTLDLRTYQDLDWDKFAIVRKSTLALAIKVPMKSSDLHNVKFLIFNMVQDSATTIFRNEILYRVQDGKRIKPEVVRNFDYQTRRTNIYDLRTSTTLPRTNGSDRSGIGRRSLISPGGLPLITIVSTRSDGTVQTLDAQTSYMLTGMLGISGGSNGSNSGSYYGYLDYLDPLWTPDGGSTGIYEVVEWEMDEGPDLPAINLNEFLRCFDNIPDAGASYSIKVMVDIPVDNNSNSLINLGANGLSVGHVFINLTKTNGSNSATQTLGFYPATDYKSVSLNPVTSKVSNDGSIGTLHEYNASITLDGWNGAEFRALLDQLRLNSTMRYEIDGFNCANFIGTSINAVKPGTLNSVSTIGVNPLNPTELINIPWSPNGLYKSLVDLKATNPGLAPKIETNVVKQGPPGNGPC